MISFSYQIHNDNSDIDESSAKSWIKNVISLEGKKLGSIHYIFCDDSELLSINKAHLNHDTLTDIISFPTSINEDIISGEIYISIDRVIENAKINSTMFECELNRVIIHGILHFIGYNDHTSVEKKQMRSREDKYLLLLPKI